MFAHARNRHVEHVREVWSSFARASSRRSAWLKSPRKWSGGRFTTTEKRLELFAKAQKFILFRLRSQNLWFMGNNFSSRRPLFNRNNTHITKLSTMVPWYHGTMVLYTQKVNLRGVASYTSH